MSGPVAPLEPKPELVADNVVTVARDPRYARYLKMVHVVSGQIPPSSLRFFR